MENLRGSTMRHKEIRLVLSGTLLVGLVVALYGYNTHKPRTQTIQSEHSTLPTGSVRVVTDPDNQSLSVSEQSASSTGSMIVVAGQDSQPLSIYSDSKQNNASSTVPTTSSSKVIRPSYTRNSTTGYYTGINNLVPYYGGTPMPDFDFGRPSPTLEMPPTQCVKQVDSSYPC